MEMKTKRERKMRLLWVVLGFLPFSVGAEQEHHRPKNVVVVLVDDLGWADLACYGSEFNDTPNLDELAARGTRFNQAYAASPVCSPTRAALMSGRDPVRLGITDWIPGHRVPPGRLLETPPIRSELAPDEVTLGELYKEHGYTTGYFGKWHLGIDEAYWPEHRGFDVNKGGISVGTPPGGYYSPYDNPRLEDGPEGEYLTNRLTDEAIAFIRGNRDDPFLVYLAFYSVHGPIQGYDKWDAYYEAKSESLPAEVREAYEIEGIARTRLHQSDPLYAAMVRAVDDNVGRLLAELEALGLDERTVVVFTSDNGGMSTRGGRNLAPTSNKPLRAGKSWGYEGGLRVPLIIRAPDHPHPGAVSEQTSISMDLMPTLLDLTGLPSRPDLHLDGISLVPALADPDYTEARTLTWHYPHYHTYGWTPGSAIRSGDWKMLLFYETGNRQLYNLAEDIGETRDLANQHPRRLDDLTDLLNKRLDAIGAQIPQRR